MRQLSQSLTANLAVLDKMFGTSADYYAKEITIYHCRGSILLFDGMASLDSLWELLLDAASRQAPPQQAGQRCTGPQVFELILHGSAFPAESEPVTDLADLIKRMTAGMAVLLLDGCAKGIAFSVQGLKFRSVDEPSGEGNLRGSREGFADLLRVNLSLLRRLIRTEHLVQEVAQADTEMQTEYAICYCKNRADSAMVIRVRKALAAAKPELLLDSSYFVPWLLPGKARLFTPEATPSGLPWRRQRSVRARSWCWSTEVPLPWCFRLFSAKILSAWTIMHPPPCFPLFCASSNMFRSTSQYFCRVCSSVWRSTCRS